VCRLAAAAGDRYAELRSELLQARPEHFDDSAAPVLLIDAVIESARRTAANSDDTAMTDDPDAAGALYPLGGLEPLLSMLRDPAVDAARAVWVVFYFLLVRPPGGRDSRQ